MSSSDKTCHIGASAAAATLYKLPVFVPTRLTSSFTSDDADLELQCSIFPLNDSNGSFFSKWISENSDLNNLNNKAALQGWGVSPLLFDEPHKVKVSIYIWIFFFLQIEIHTIKMCFIQPGLNR